jgi:hypothetical protein
MKIYEQMKQRSEEWHNIRKGKITGSILKDLISAKTFKISNSKTAEIALLKIIAGKYVSVDEERPGTPDKIRGIIGEPIARELYKKKYLPIDVELKEVGFIESDCKRYGMSPDGLLSDGGIIEIKCPIQANHLKAKYTNGKYLLEEDGYILQIMMAFILDENIKYCDFISYNEDFKKTDHKIFVFRIERNEEQVDLVKQVLFQALDKLDKIESELCLK